MSVGRRRRTPARQARQTWQGKHRQPAPRRAPEGPRQPRRQHQRSGPAAAPTNAGACPTGQPGQSRPAPADKAGGGQFAARRAPLVRGVGGLESLLARLLVLPVGPADPRRLDGSGRINNDAELGAEPN
eukprot:9013129-Alexandrium_andersonii.AAC.1